MSQTENLDTSGKFLLHVSEQISDLWRLLGAGEDDLNRGGATLPSEIDCGVSITEAQYSAAVVILLWDAGFDDALYEVGVRRDWLLAARNEGFEPEEVAQFAASRM